MAESGNATHDLGEFLREELDGATIEDLTRLSGGASRETWRFRADDVDLVVQRQRDGDERDMAVEAAVVRAAGATGVPVPRLIASGLDSSGTTAHMILEAVEGETIARRIQRDDEFGAARSALTAQLGAALARVHEIEPDAVSGLEAPDQVERYTEVLDAVSDGQPVLELVRRWLIRHRPPLAAPKVVHGDFRLGNVIVGPDGLRAVIDWELAHLGDPLEDLAWLCVKAWRFGQPAPVAGIGERDELIDAYESAGGAPVDRVNLFWWEVLGTWKWAIMCVLQADVHLSGASRSHELAAIGRRVCENEHDLLEMLGDRLLELATPSKGPST